MHYQSITNELSSRVAKQTELSILQQLSDFVSRGLIIVEHGPMVLTHSVNNSGIEIKQTIELKLKDKEYIERLEKENERYRQILKEKGL
jgi:hypothetical protein